MIKSTTDILKEVQEIQGCSSADFFSIIRTVFDGVEQIDVSLTFNEGEMPKIFTFFSSDGQNKLRHKMKLFTKYIHKNECV